jgi:hypothetical protein
MELAIAYLFARQFTGNSLGNLDRKYSDPQNIIVFDTAN